MWYAVKTLSKALIIIGIFAIMYWLNLFPLLFQILQEILNKVQGISQ